MENASIENLRPIKLSHDEAMTNGIKGGIKSGESRRRSKAIKEALRLLLETDTEQDGDVLNGYDLLALAMFKKAIKGNVAAFTAIRDTIEKPATILATAEVSQQVIDEVEAAVLGL